MAEKALQSRGEIEFVYAKKDTYPLAYVRTANGEKILVIINPAAREVCFDYETLPKETVYCLGKEVIAENGKITVPAQSAGFYRI